MHANDTMVELQLGKLYDELGSDLFTAMKIDIADELGLSQDYVKEYYRDRYEAFHASLTREYRNDTLERIRSILEA